MFLLLSTALAAEGPLEVTGGEVLFHASDLRGPLDPYNFGVRVGDDDMLAAYKTLNRQRKAVAFTGWIGGGVMVYGGLGAMVLGAFEGSPVLIMAGLGAAGVGATGIVVGSVAHGVLGNQLDEYDRWWTYDQAVALADTHNAALGMDFAEASAIEIVDQGNGFAAYDSAGRLDAGDFADRVGDSATYAKWNAVRLSCNGVGWAGFGVGMYGLSIFGGEVMGDLVSGVAPELVPGLIVLGAITGALGGPLLVYGSKVLYNDVSRWYDRDEAEGWAAGPQREARGPEVEIHPTALVVRW
jgi:hypothetical protein